MKMPYKGGLFHLIFQVCSANMLLSAAAELECERATVVFLPLISFSAHFIILCETVPVKRISKSGLPIFFIQALIFGYTFALQENVSHISIYCLTIHSFPPNITTLIFMSSPVFG